MMRENEDNVVTLEVQVGEFSTQDLSRVSTVFRHMDRLKSQAGENLINPAMGNSPTKQSKAESSQATPARTGPPGMGGKGGMGSTDPFSVGRSDLDPLSGLGGPGGGGGGMIMDPRFSGGPRFGPGGGRGVFGGPSRGGGIHPGALPPGAVPPGARFDHFGPPGSRPGPDPDHEQPPNKTKK